jgi:NAD(P) transhydrogenase subunit alpha
MKPGSVLVDLAVERGGNVAGAKPDQIADIGGVKIIGYTNLPARIPADASNLYARNLAAFVGLLVDDKGALAPDLEDEILKGSMLTHEGAIVHPAFQGA